MYYEGKINISHKTLCTSSIGLIRATYDRSRTMETINYIKINIFWQNILSNTFSGIWIDFIFNKAADSIDNHLLFF